MPGNERFYSFDYNDIHFIIINSNENMNGQFDMTVEQKDWLINDLSTNELDFIVAAYHHPSYSIRDTNRVHVARSVRETLEPIFVDYGVDVVFNGHDHYYYRTLRNDIMYVTTGGAGANLYVDNDRQDWQEGDIYFSNYHYCLITVSDETLNVDVYSFNDIDKSTTLADTFQISPQVSSGLSSSSSQTTPTNEKSSSTPGSKTSNSDGSPFVYSDSSFILAGIFVVSLLRYKKRKMKI
jgi:hypothetical protein